MTFVYILLAIIAFILWKIYRQREEEKEAAEAEKFDAEWEAKKKEELKDYPHLYGKLESNWLEVFAMHSKRGTPLLKLAFMLMLPPSTKMELSEGSMAWDNLWTLSEELLEHLDKYHEGSTDEHEIAVVTYWQVAAEAIEDVINENPEIEGDKLRVEPFTNITKIPSYFPKKSNHPDEEFSFTDKDNKFPRESDGSDYIKEKLRKQGV